MTNSNSNSSTEARGSCAQISSNLDINLLIGTGGSRSILFGTGVLLALAQCNFRRFRSIGGVSGGSMPASIIANQPDVTALLDTVLDTDFNKLVKRRVSLVRFLTRVLAEPKAIDPPPLEGALDASGFGAFFDDLIRQWPDTFWTMALSHQKQVVFTGHGVYEEQEDGSLRLTSNTAVGVGTAIRATCAVPLLLDPVVWKNDQGVEHLLIDGGLGPEGRCPISVPGKLHSLSSSYLVVVNVGQDKSSLHQLIDRVFGTVCDDRESLREDVPVADGPRRIVVTPTSPLYGSFKFKMTQREKWEMILSGYMAAVEAFDRHGLFCEEALHTARDRGTRALLLMAHRSRGQKDRLPPALRALFNDLKFGPEKF